MPNRCPDCAINACPEHYGGPTVEDLEADRSAEDEAYDRWRSEDAMRRKDGTD